MLRLLGLDTAAEIVYAELLSARPMAVDEVVRTTGISPVDADVALRSLQHHGLVEVQDGHPLRYLVVDPEISLGGILLGRHEQLRQARIQAAEFMDRFRQAMASRDPAEVIEVVTGAEAIEHRVEQALRTAERELRILDKPPYVNQTDLDPNDAELALLARGGTVRAIYETAAIDRDGRLTVIQMWATRGEQARVVPRLPSKLGLVDDRLGILPLRAAGMADQTPSFVILRRSAVLDALAALFECLWAGAMPLDLSNPGTGDALTLTSFDRQVIALLTAGMPDEAIARQLQVSHRTVQRRLRGLMERAGVQSRFQFGIQAVLKGWVSDG